MKNKSIIKTLVIGGLLLGTIATTAMANNCQNTTFEFNWGNWETKAYTSERPKEDSSSLWMQCKRLTDENYYKTRVFVNADDVTYKDRKVFYENTTDYLPSLAYEKYGSGVEVSIEGDTGFINLGDPTAEGDWSPDSV